MIKGNSFTNYKKKTDFIEQFEQCRVAEHMKTEKKCKN